MKSQLTAPFSGFWLALFLCLSLHQFHSVAQEIPLAGTWRFQQDRANQGTAEQWWARQLTEKATLPGDLAAQGIGDPPSVQTRWVGGIQKPNWHEEPALRKYAEPGNFKFPFWLTPERRYQGAAWFQRDIEIPADWGEKRVVLFLERPHWETRVWLDDKCIGTNNALGTPHEYDLGRVVPGTHRLTIRVDNSVVVDVGENSHSISDHTQGNWNGIVGRVELRAFAAVWIEDLQVFPNLAAGTFSVRGRVGSLGTPGLSSILFEVKRRSGETASLARGRIPVTWKADGGAFEWKPSAAQVKALETWDEFTPNVYELTAVLQSSGARTTVPLALREVSTRGTQFLINGRKTFFRGTLECAIFPKTGHPPTDVESWKRIVKTCQDHGLNMIRFHSWCPPEAAFIAADELGFYYQVECSSWANQTTTLGDGKPVDQWLYAEADRMLKFYGNHPSFLLMPFGNEPGGSKHVAYLAKWVEHYKARDPRRLYTSGSGCPQIPENQFHVTPDPRIQGWGQGLSSRINSKPPETTTDYRDYVARRQVPVISHEIGQWCVFPNFDEIPKYTGYLKARNFEIFRDSLEANHLGRLSRQFLQASGKLQALCYKEDIEAILRTPGIGGFQLLDLHDFPGQGTALVGVLDPFWESKGYVTAAEYSRFCNRTVPLARLPKRVFTVAENFHAEVEVAHFGASPMENAVPTWRIIGPQDAVLAQGKLPAQTVPVDNGIQLGAIDCDLKSVPAPAKCRLVLGFENTQIENDWDFWVYPAQVETKTPADILVTKNFDESAITRLQQGGKVLLTIPGKRLAPGGKGRVALGFSSIFWNTAWTQNQPPHTLGILCDPGHPALTKFPTEFHSNWQWWYLIHEGGAMELDQLPPELDPIVRVIDDWVTNRRLALAFEAQVGSGRILVTSANLAQTDNPVSRQMIHSLLSYMGSTAFNPRVAITVDQVSSLMAGPGPMEKHGAKIKSASSSQPGFEAANAIDGNPETMWHTFYDEPKAVFPHSFEISFDKIVTIRGFNVLPRQDGNRNGRIKDYVVYVSVDGFDWGKPAAQGTLPDNGGSKQIDLPVPVRAQHIRFVALSGHANGPWASLAEFSIIE